MTYLEQSAFKVPSPAESADFLGASQLTQMPAGGCIFMKNGKIKIDTKVLEEDGILPKIISGEPLTPGEATTIKFPHKCGIEVEPAPPAVLEPYLPNCKITSSEEERMAETVNKYFDRIDQSNWYDLGKDHTVQKDEIVDFLASDEASKLSEEELKDLIRVLKRFDEIKNAETAVWSHEQNGITRGDLWAISNPGKSPWTNASIMLSITEALAK
jgi:hypothetical protein